MPLQATSGAASYDAFGGGAAAVPTYIEDVFSCFLYSGNSSTQTITNDIDLSSKGGLVWIKRRTGFSVNHYLNDTVQGATQYLSSNTTNATQSISGLTAFNTNGFTLGSNNIANGSSENYASWTFRKQPKFFDVVTYTGNSSTQSISHNLGSVPGCIIVKATNASDGWRVYHTSTGAGKFGSLNGTSAFAASSTIWNNTTPTSTVFSLGNVDEVNRSGTTYVAYVFAHDAGGFGLTGTDNVISCATYTGNGSATGPVITLGYEPQWVMIKRSDSTADWYIFDSMRGIPMTGDTPHLLANTSGIEAFGQGHALELNATGFSITNTFGATNASGGTYIYIAIRRGPMKVPTSGTSVFTPVAYTGDGSTRTQSVGFPTDLSINKNRAVDNTSIRWTDRLRGNGAWVASTSTGSENAEGSTGTCFDNQTNIILSTERISSGVTYVNYSMRRAPSFFDEVCYTGTGSNPNVQTHNLGVAPELMIIKRRNSTADWLVATQFTASTFLYLYLDLDIGNTASSYPSGVLTAQPSSTSFSIASTGNVLNATGGTYVAYLFATCAGVSKVFSYTGNGSSQTINCGFTGGARFVLIKRTDSTGDWYVWDSARGIVSGNDPHLSLNTTAVEVTSNDTIDTDSTGFVVNQVSATNVNVSSATYIGLAIA